MHINEEGLNLVKSFEGFHLTAYKCPAGVWTIGYGHTGKVDGKAIGAGMKITETKATELLKADMQKFETAVKNCALTFEPNENQFSALVSFAFNCGAGNLKTLVKDRSPEVIAEKILLYNKAGGVVLKGLVRRRKAEQELFLKESTVKNPMKCIDEIAKEVIAGKWGSGDARKQKLLVAGYDPVAVQALVNQMLHTGYYDRYTGTSQQIDVVFRKIGVPEKYIGNKMKRKPIALANGITNYTGTGSQNLSLIALAKKGKLKKV